MLNKLLQDIYVTGKKKTKREEILNSLEHKMVNGIFIEASGRLSKRFTAARSLHKDIHIGSLRNINSSYKGLSSSMLRGHAKSNVQYSKESSKTRNGSFGLKVWISGK